MEFQFDLDVMPMKVSSFLTMVPLSMDDSMSDMAGIEFA